MKTYFKALSLFTLGTTLLTNSAFGVFGMYIGASGGNAYFKKDSTNPDQFNRNAFVVGANAGAEFNLLAVTLGLEAFYEKSINTGDFQISIDSKLKDFFDPTFYGAKGKIAMNLIILDPYISLGYGQEKAGDYKQDFILFGAGFQKKFSSLGVFGELNYLKSTKAFENINSSSRFAITVGLRWYFINL
jgi:hypothetical protein